MVFNGIQWYSMVFEWYIFVRDTQDLDVPCSSLSTKPYSEGLVTYVEYEHGVKARLEHGI